MFTTQNNREKKQSRTIRLASLCSALSVIIMNKIKMLIVQAAHPAVLCRSCRKGRF